MNTKYTPTPWSIISQSDGSAMIAREYETGKQMNPKGSRHVALEALSAPKAAKGAA